MGVAVFLGEGSGLFDSNFISVHFAFLSSFLPESSKNNSRCVLLLAFLANDSKTSSATLSCGFAHHPHQTEPFDNIILLCFSIVFFKDKSLYLSTIVSILPFMTISYPFAYAIFIPFMR